LPGYCWPRNILLIFVNTKELQQETEAGTDGLIKLIFITEAEIGGLIQLVCICVCGHAGEQAQNEK
jgi:hypothetical protein